MRRVLRTCALLLLGTVVAGGLTGCASKHVISETAPGADMASLRSFYVRKHEPDNRGVEQVISNQLEAMGFESTSGADVKPPGVVDAIVSYEDHWMWDITMYMLQIDIEFRDPETEAVLATGQSYRTSMVRKPKEAMVRETLYKMFGRELPEDEVKGDDELASSEK